jgi:DNA/RNA endonuclease YhcR with UshA esterase domain
MKSFFCFLLLAAFSAAKAQKPVRLEEVKDHIGDSVTVIGKVYGIKYLEQAKGAPTLINLGAAFPNQLLTVVIFGEDRKRLALEPEKRFADALVSVSGKVELFKGKPQIVITDNSQITAAGQVSKEGQKTQ